MESPSSRNEDATITPPRLPRMLRLTATERVCTGTASMPYPVVADSVYSRRCQPAASSYVPAPVVDLLLRRHIPLARAHVIRPLAHVDADRVPPSVLRTRGGVSHVVLLALLVCDSGGRGIEITRPPDDLGPTTAVVGDI